MRWLLGMIAALLASTPVAAQGYLHRQGTRIVDGDGKPVLLRGMGIGGWMLQEGYMLGLGELGKGQQHVIRRHIAELIGEAKTEAFYTAWLDNFVTRADIDAMAGWGFNSVRLPMHYDLLTLPIEREPVAGEDTWHESGFQRIDRLLAWTRANGMHLILDLHAAPGGQGNDLPIADRDPGKPSLWDSAENRRKTVALWKKLAARYANEPGIGAYDILNEPNWDFDGLPDGHGCKSTRNAPLWAFYAEIIAAIRSVDRNHMIIVEGNCWGNNYGGLDRPLDPNMALSFHKYWNRNDTASIAPYLALRDRLGLPLWLGESGENSNVWFRDAIRLAEDNGIGWSWWPLKKLRFNNPLQINANPGWTALVAGWLGKGPMPDAKAAEAALMALATHDVQFGNNIFHPDVIDALIRQPHDPTARPYWPNQVRGASMIAAANYDLGPAGIAYRDRDDANYHVATGGPRTRWNSGETYRNDGVDLALNAQGEAYVTRFETGEWMQYTLDFAPEGARQPVRVRARSRRGGVLSLSLNGGRAVPMRVRAGAGWRTLRFPEFAFAGGTNRIRLTAERCRDCEIESLAFVYPD